MFGQVLEMTKKLKKIIDRVSNYKAIVMSLAVIVVFITTYLLILPAFTLEKDKAAEQGGIDLPATVVDVDSEVDQIPASKTETVASNENGSDKKQAESDKEETSDKKADAKKQETVKEQSDPLKYEGDKYNVSVIDSNGVLPDDVHIDVTEIDKKKDSKDYKKYYEGALSAINDEKGVDKAQDIGFVHFYDISLKSGNKEIEPEEGDKVNVKIEYDEEFRKDLKIDDADKVKIVHFTKDIKTGKLNADVLDVKDNSVQVDTDKKDLLASTEFEADSFSVYAVVYTVDFAWEVEGKTYKYALSGGNAISLKSLLEALKVTNDSEAFVAEVKNVEFSDPELVWVGKADKDTTVGEIKEKNKLDCVYSGELTKNQIADIDKLAIKAGDWALISMLPFTSEETLTVSMKDGQVFTIKVTDEQISANVLTADNQTYSITVTYDETAKIPVGTRLVVEEIGQDTEEFINCVAKTLNEINKDYFAQQDLLRSGADPDVVKTVQPISMDQARFFHITLMYKGKEIEPKTPVQVDIKYADGLGVKKVDERIPGVSHITNDGVEVISKVETETDEKGRIIEFEYTQDSFSDIGTFVGHEGHDRLMEKANAPKVDLRAGETSGTPSVDDFKNEYGAPKASKKLSDNGDGTYTLALHVKPESSEYTVESRKANVLFIMDRSSSMNKNSDESYLEFESEAAAIAAVYDGTNVYGHFDNGRYSPLSYMINDAGVGVWTSGSGPYDISNGLFYGLSGSRFVQEQAALGNLIQELMAKNQGEGNQKNVEISIISFATYTGSDQVYSYVGGTSTSNWGGTDAHKNDPAYRWGNTEVDWTDGTDTTDLMDAVNDNSMARGTNWEEALKNAREVMDAKMASDGDNEDYYVVFLTDGAPTATSESINNHDTAYEWGAWYGDNGGAGYHGDEGYPIAYDAAKDDAQGLVAAGNKLFNIFTYGESDDYKYMVRLTNYAYSGGTDDTANESTEAAGEYFKNATNTNELVDYFNKIFKEITGNIGHSQVKVKDGLTQGAMTSTFVEGKPSAVKYTVTPSAGSSKQPYTVQATMPEEGTEPVVTFTINGRSYTTTSGDVQKKVNPDDAYNAGTYYSVTVGGVEYKMALAGVDGSGELTWDLTPLGILWDDSDYKAEFVVWPKQEAYNYVAGLNNGMPGFKWDEDTASQHEHTDSKGRKYWSNGVSDYPSIVKYEDGTFAVLTNTHQEVEYSVSQIEDGELIDQTDPDSENLNFPDPMPLNATKTNLEKQWSVDRNPAILAQYLYNPDGTPTEFVAKFDIFSDNSTKPFATVSLGWDSDLGKYVWDESSLRRVVSNGHVYYIGTRWSDEINIATGLMLTIDRMEALGLNPAEYPKAIYQGTIYYILERGHDYHVKENDDGNELGYEFDFVSPVFHPMLVNGKMVNIVFEEEMDDDTLDLNTPYPIEQMTPAPMNSIGALVVDNSLRGYINVEKIVVDKDGKTVLNNDETRFNYRINLVSDLEPGPFTIEGSHVPWYGINGLFYHAEIDGTTYYFQADPLGGSSLTLTTESGDTYTAETTSGDAFDPDSVGPTEISYTDENNNPVTLELKGNQMIHDSDNHVHDTIQIMQGQILNIANVPKGTRYTITETEIAQDYDLMKIESQIRDGESIVSRTEVEDISSGSFTGEIVSNRDNHVIFTNKIHSADLKVKKTDESGGTLLGAQFTLTKTGTDETWTLPEDGTADIGTYTFMDLADGVYTLTETPPTNYTGINPITFAVAHGVIYMPGDTLPEGVTLPDSALPAGVNWTNNSNKTFSLTIPNEHIQPEPDEIRVEKRWVDENDNPAQGTKDVKVQLRRYKIFSNHNVKVHFHADGYQWGGQYHPDVDYYSEDLLFSGNTLTLTYTEQNSDYGNQFNVVVRKRSTQSVITSQNNRSGRNVTITVPNVDDDIDITVSYNSGNYQINRDRNGILGSIAASPAGNADADVIVDEEFSSDTTLSSPAYTASWTIGNGSEYDFPLSDGSASYQYYIVELDENDQPLAEGQGSLVSITNNEGITTGIITATNKINGSLTLKKVLDVPTNEDVSLAAGKYNFTVTGPGESGKTKYVQIRIDAEDAVTYKVSDDEISFSETSGFVDAPSDGTVLIPDLLAGTYKVTEGEFQLDDDQDGKYTMKLGQIDVESGTADLSGGSATLNVRAENTPSAAATFTNMLVPLVDVPVIKNWQWAQNDNGKVESWTATFNLEYREVLVSGEEASDAKRSWTPVYETDGTTQKSITLRSTDSDQEKFNDLPLYKAHDNGSVYRLIYSVDEVAYTINYNDGRDPATETWSKNESGHLSDHYSPDYEQDAGEGNMPQEGMDEWYTIHLTNVRSTKEIQKTVDLSLEKQWDHEALQDYPDAWAKFQLKRTYHEEYLDYNKFDLDPDDLVTVKLNLGNGVTKELVVPRGAPVYVTAVIKPEKTVNFRFSKDNETLILSGGDSDSTSQQFIYSSAPFYATADGDEVNVSFVSGDTSALVGGLDGLGLACFDPEETTEEQEDASFENQNAGKVFTLDAEHGWHKEWAGLPQTVQELTVTNNGTRLKTIVYSYYLEEKECYPKNYTVSFNNGQGDEQNPLISSADVIAKNKLETTELNGTKTWNVGDDTSYVLGTPVLKLTRRTELTDPEPVTVSWEGEEQFLQPTWHTIDGFTRSFTYADLPKKDKDGNTYEYSVEEIEFTVGAGENAVVYKAVKQPNGTYIVTISTEGKEGADTFVVTQDGNDIVNKLKRMTIEIIKIDETTRGDQEQEKLSGARFRLLKYNGSIYEAYEGEYGSEDGVPVGSSGEDLGKLIFDNLPNGEYMIVETDMPTGYSKIENNDIYFSITGGILKRYDSPVGTEGRALIPALTYDEDSHDTVTNVVAGISYVNNVASGLTTFGTTIFYVLGSILVICGGIYFIGRRRARR